MIAVNESDWKLFRRCLPEWQEDYMKELVRGYARLLSSPGNASDHFWELEKRIREDKRSAGVVAEVSRSTMYQTLAELLEDDVITMDDLDDFSSDTKRAVAMFMG